MSKSDNSSSSSSTAAENIVHIFQTDNNGDDNDSRSQFHFKPLKILSMTKEYITMEGREAISNATLSIRIPPDQFRKMCDRHPDHTNRFLTTYLITTYCDNLKKKNQEEEKTT